MGRRVGKGNNGGKERARGERERSEWEGIIPGYIC